VVAVRLRGAGRVVAVVEVGAVAVVVALALLVVALLVVGLGRRGGDRGRRGVLGLRPLRDDARRTVGGLAAVPMAAAAAEVAAVPPRTACLSAKLGTTGSRMASAARWRWTSSRNSRQAGQLSRWRRRLPRRNAPPRAVASCSRISAHGVSRASRAAMSPSRA